MAANKSNVTAWKIAAIDRLIEEQGARMAPQELRKLKALKRRPGNLLTLAHNLPTDAESQAAFDHHARRMRRLPEDQKILAALEHEQRLINGERHPKDTAEQWRMNQDHFARRTLQSLRAGNGRVKINERHRTVTIRELVSELARRNPAKPKELWPHFYDTLKNEVGDDNFKSVGTGDKSVYHYNFNGKRWRKLSFISFRKLVPIVRKG